MKDWAEWFYNSTTWRRTRAAFLRSRGYLCERCAAKGDVVPAWIVHHREYLTPDNIKDPGVALDWDNLEAVCQRCHNEEHHGQKREVRYEFDEDGNIIQHSPHV
jgi:5-methylcytosine-specific restriction endonuclease McrA